MSKKNLQDDSPESLVIPFLPLFLRCSPHLHCIWWHVTACQSDADYTNDERDHSCRALMVSGSGMMLSPPVPPDPRLYIPSNCPPPLLLQPAKHLESRNGPIPPRHPSPFCKVQKLSRPSATTTAHGPSMGAGRSDPYHGHGHAANLCVRFVSYLFACPDIPPPLAPPSTTQPSAEPLHHTLSTASGFIHLTRGGANRPTGYVHAVRHH